MSNIIALLQTCEVSGPAFLWYIYIYRDSLSEVFKHQAQLKYSSMEMYFNDEIYKKALIKIYRF